MHLNTRRPPLHHLLLSFLPSFVRPHLPATSTSTPTVPPPQTKQVRRASGSGVMPSIPPSSNPRGELIFSSRVDRGFREGYERYRSAFERRREEKERKERAGWWRLWRRKAPEAVVAVLGGGEKGKVAPTPPISRRGTPPIPITVSSISSTSAGGLGKGRTRTPSPSSLRFEDKAPGGGRERAESYSFVWTGTRDTGPLKRAP